MDETGIGLIGDRNIIIIAAVVAVAARVVTDLGAQVAAGAEARVRAVPEDGVEAPETLGAAPEMSIVGTIISRRAMNEHMGE